jgi:hypothetical protein
MMWKFLWVILPTELQRDSNWDLHIVTCPLTDKIIVEITDKNRDSINKR